MISYDAQWSLLDQRGGICSISLPSNSLTIAPVKASASGMIKVCLTSEKKTIVTIKSSRLWPIFLVTESQMPFTNDVWLITCSVLRHQSLQIRLIVTCSTPEAAVWTWCWDQWEGWEWWHHCWDQCWWDTCNDHIQDVKNYICRVTQMQVLRHKRGKQGLVVKIWTIWH